MVNLAKRQTLNMYNFCSSLAIDLELSSYIIHQGIYEGMDFGGRSFTVSVDIT